MGLLRSGFSFARAISPRAPERSETSLFHCTNLSRLTPPPIPGRVLCIQSLGSELRHRLLQELTMPGCPSSRSQPSASSNQPLGPVVHSIAGRQGGPVPGPAVLRNIPLRCGRHTILSEVTRQIARVPYGRQSGRGCIFNRNGLSERWNELNEAAARPVKAKARGPVEAQSNRH